MKKVLLMVILTITLTICDLSAQKKRIYIANDDHTDMMWTATDEVYEQVIPDVLDYYLKINDSTANNPFPYQHRWNCDGSYWVYLYKKHRSPQQFDILIRQIKEGKITVPFNTLVTLTGVAPLEATLREMYYAGSLEKKYGLDLDLVIAMEDQVLPLGLSSLWAGAGAKYAWKGVCDCATKVKGFASRPHEIYWFTGLDGRRILMKWYSLMWGNNENLGGYAECFDTPRAVEQSIQLMKLPKYPYNVAGAFGKGWDWLYYKSPEFIDVAQKYSDDNYQVFVSNKVDFFRDFEREYGAILPSESLSYGASEWGLGIASMAELSAEMKRSVEKLRTAEGLYTLAALKDKSFGKGLEEMREKAWIAAGLYFEHGWTADGRWVTRKQRADWQRTIAKQFTAYVDTLYDLSMEKMGELIARPSKKNEAFYVYNPLSWKRTDYSDYPYAGSENITVTDAAASINVPFQVITRNNESYLRILASEVPPLGYKVYEISPGAAGKYFPPAAQVRDTIIENSRYQITVTSTGVITSLKDKNDNAREYIREINHLFANDLGGGPGRAYQGFPVKVENAGPVSVTLATGSYRPLKHTTRITLFANSDRIEIENIINQNFDAKPVTYSFSFNMNSPEIWHEEAGAIMSARQQSQGGHYADSICRLDWLAMNHFVKIADQECGMVISNRDAYFMKPGNSTVEKIDTSTPQVHIMAGGQVDAPGLGIVNQDGNSFFQNFFALQPVSDPNDHASSMRFALEHQNPLVASRISGSEKKYGNSFSLFSISDPDVIAWSVKPAEEGIDNGVILRVWNMNSGDRDMTISSPFSIVESRLASHVENDIIKIAPVKGLLKVNIGHDRLETYRLFLK